MILKNVTRKTIITNDLKIANTLKTRLFGLLDSDNPRSLLLKTRFGIHTFGLNRSIDALIVDENNTVRVTKTISPNRILMYNPKYNAVVELPYGYIKKSKTQLGDKIIIS